MKLAALMNRTRARAQRNSCSGVAPARHICRVADRFSRGPRADVGCPVHERVESARPVTAASTKLTPVIFAATGRKHELGDLLFSRQASEIARACARLSF